MSDQVDPGHLEPQPAPGVARGARAPAGRAARRRGFVAALAAIAFGACGAPEPAAVGPQVDSAEWRADFAQRLPAMWAAALDQDPASAPAAADLLASTEPPWTEGVPLAAAYAERAPVRYVDDDGLTPLGEALLERLRAAGAEGLDPADFLGPALESAAQAFTAARGAGDAIRPPAPPAVADVDRLVAAGGRPEGDGAEQALLARALDPAGPLPGWAAAFDEARRQRAPLRVARLRYELRIAEALARYARTMRRENTATAERLARRAPPKADAASEATTADGPPPAAPGTPAPPSETPLVLRDRGAFVNDRLAADLRSVTDRASLDALLEALTPPHPQYRPVRQALARYRDFEARGGWAALKAAPLKPGAKGEAVTRLAARLAFEGFAVAADLAVYDDTLKAAVERYQQVHQLRATGQPDATFWRVLNVPVEARVAALVRTLAVLRKSRVDEDRQFVAINIPDFHLEVWRDGARALRNRIVVGKGGDTKCDEVTQRVILAFATPVQSSEIDQIVFAPYWNLTRDIKETEYDFERGKDPQYYEKNGYEVLRLGKPDEQVRQLPGPGNALGIVKFLFPNPHSTYVHDTPQKPLFNEPVRAFSHGCMRLDQPVSLARDLLTADGQWDEERFNQLHKDWKELGARIKNYDPARWSRVLLDATRLQTQVFLKDPMPIHVEYYVTRVADDGLVEFLTDIYQIDAGRWARGGSRCTPEHAHARAGLDGVLDVVTQLETEAQGLEGRVSGLVARVVELEAVGAEGTRVARQLRKLEAFATDYRNLAAHIRTQHEAVTGALEKQGGWTKSLERQAVALRRLVQGLEATVRKASRTCDRAEAALGG